MATSQQQRQHEQLEKEAGEFRALQKREYNCVPHSMSFYVLVLGLSNNYSFVKVTRVFHRCLFIALVLPELNTIATSKNQFLTQLNENQMVLKV